MVGVMAPMAVSARGWRSLGDSGDRVPEAAGLSSCSVLPPAQARPDRSDIDRKGWCSHADTTGSRQAALHAGRAARVRTVAARQRAAYEPPPVGRPGSPARPGAAPGGAERRAGALAGPASPRAHECLALHVLPGYRTDHGRGSGNHAEQWSHGPTGWRRPPLELRGLRLTRAPAGVRRER